MSSSHRRDRGALAALGLVLAAIVLVAWITALQNSVYQNQASGSDTKPQEHGSSNAANRISGVDDFNPWHDSFAQWGMLAFSGIAAAISVWAIIWVKRTWVEAKRSADISEDSAKRQLRAYVCINQATVLEPADEFGFKARIDFVNFGQTPAHDLTIRCRVKTVGAYRLRDFDMSLDGEEGTEPTVVGPSAGMSKTIDNILDPEERNSIVREDATVMIVGDVRYRDIFNACQITEFCLRVRYFGQNERQRIHPWEVGNKAT